MNFVKNFRSVSKAIFDKIRNEQLKNNLLQAVPFWVASLLTGLLAVLYTRLFSYAERGTSYIVLHHLWWLFIITPVCFVLSWWVVVRFAPYSRGSGIPQIMACHRTGHTKIFK